MDILDIINSNLQKFEDLKNCSESDIYKRCQLIRIQNSLKNTEDKLKFIKDIQSVLGFKEWDSLVDEANDVTLMFKRFVDFVTNPRKVNY